MFGNESVELLGVAGQLRLDFGRKHDAFHAHGATGDFFGPYDFGENFVEVTVPRHVFLRDRHIKSLPECGGQFGVVVDQLGTFDQGKKRDRLIPTQTGPMFLGFHHGLADRIVYLPVGIVASGSSASLSSDVIASLRVEIRTRRIPKSLPLVAVLQFLAGTRKTVAPASWAPAIFWRIPPIWPTSPSGLIWPVPAILAPPVKESDTSRS